MNTFTLRMGVMAAVLAGASGMAHSAMPLHTFDSDNQGWRYAGGDVSVGVNSTLNVGGAVGWDGRGNPGGALAAGDVYGETFVAAPSEFLGDQSDMLGKAIQYDIFIRHTDGIDYTPMNILGGGLNLIHASSQPPVGQWQTRVVNFVGSEWRVGSQGGAVATDAQVLTALTNLEGLYICTEWKTGPDDTSLDNIGAVPEPASLLALGMAALVARRRRSA